MTRIGAHEGWTHGVFSKDGVHVPYTRTGATGKPTAVLVHGFNDNGLGWSRVAQGLQDSYDVLMPDNRGHGISRAASSGFTVVDMAEDLAGLITSLDIAPVLLVGHSMGGCVVAELAHRHPDLVRKLVVVDSPFLMATKLGSTRRLSAVLAFSRTWSRPLSSARISRFFRVVYPRWTDEERDTMAQALFEASQHRSPGMGRLFARRRDWHQVLGEVPMPTLLLTAEKGMIKPAEREAIMAVLKDGHNVHVPGAAHNIQRDNYPAFMAALTAFSES